MGTCFNRLLWLSPTNCTHVQRQKIVKLAPHLMNISSSDPARKRSSSALPVVQSVDNRIEPRERSRFYSISSEIVPQTLTHPDEVQESHARRSRSPSTVLPNLSNVGFQSIFQNPTVRRSRQSLSSTGSSKHQSNSVRSLRMSSSPDSRSFGTDGDSLTETSKDLKKLVRKKPRLKTHTEKTERNSRLFRDPDAKNSGSMASSAISNSSHSKMNPFSKAARKLFRRGSTRHRTDSDNESLHSVPNIATSTFGKFLHSQYGKHVGKSSSHYIHTSGNLMDSRKSVYFFNPALTSNSNDIPLQLIQEANFDSNDVQMLQDLIKNLPSLESNYKAFTHEEQDALMENIWGVYCNIILSLFKNQRLWQLPAKIEGINRVLDFYIKLKIDAKVPSSSLRFINEVEEFLATSLYILENQVVFNYNNETTINTALKRLCVIWEIFYQQIYHEAMAVLLPLETSFHKNRHYWSDVLTKFGKHSEDILGGGASHHFISVDFILLKTFRDSIVLPYYQNFINTHDGASKSFQLYIISEEEENKITQQDKLVLLQCFGILSSIQTNDMNQTVIEELLIGIRMSI